jgi:hypothetical protein
MGIYREEAVQLVAKMRSIWPHSSCPIGQLDQETRTKVDVIRNDLCKFIVQLGYPEKLIRGIRKNSTDKTRKEMDNDDYVGAFWEGVSRGLLEVKSRLSDEGVEDTNDPLYYLIFRGNGAILDYRRFINLKKIIQRCNICGSIHKLFRPNIAFLPFDNVTCIEVRGFKREDMDVIKAYRRSIISEKLKRLPSSNVCKDCYNAGIKSWYPTHGPAIKGEFDFEEDLKSIDFIHVCNNTDIVEVYMSNESQDDEVLNVIENTPCNYLGDEPDYFAAAEGVSDSESLKRSSFIDDEVESLVIHRRLFDILYGSSNEPCKICPRRAKLLVNRGVDIQMIRKLISKELSRSDKLELNNLGDWDTRFVSATECGGPVNLNCDNMSQRIADWLKIQPTRVRDIIKQVQNRYGAACAAEQIIMEALTEELDETQVRSRYNK